MKKRIDSIDALRAICILIMIAGHVGFGGKFDRYIHSFHMPVFFIISGYLYNYTKQIGFTKYCIAKIKRLLVPYFVYAILNYIFWLVFLSEGISWYYPLIRLVTYNTKDLPICGALWFVTALFWTEIFYFIFDKVLKITWIRILVICVISICVALFQTRNEFRLPLTMDTAMVCLLFFEVGRLIKQYGYKILEKLSLLSWIKISVFACVALVLNLVISFLNDYVNIKSGWYGIVPVFFINAIIGSFGFYMVALLICKYFSEKNYFKKVLLAVGQKSMLYLGINQLLIFLISTYIFSLNIFVLIGVLIAFAIIHYFISKIDSKIINIVLGL